MIFDKLTKYVYWNTASSFLVSIESVLSTHNMLNTISGVTSDYVRTMNFVGKDVIGQAGALYFITRAGKIADSQPEKFLNTSHVLQQTSYFLMALTPVAPDWFVGIAGVSNLAANISFTGFGAINAKCIEELSTNNTGEVYSRVAATSTFGSTLGLTAGVAMVTYIPNSIWLLPVLGALRVYTYSRAIEELSFMNRTKR